MRVELSDRYALVTGASSGIGRAVAIGLLERGARVFVTGRRAERLEALRAHARSRDHLVARGGDIDDEGFRNSIVQDMPRVDILVNAAGTMRHSPFLEGDPLDWERMWRTNVHSVMCLTKLVAGRMVQQNSGHVVNISSILAGKVYRFTMAYAATKFAIRAISQGLRLELSEHGIRVTEVAPGQVRTEIFRDEQHPLVSEAYRQRTFAPLTPEDVADAILAALSSSPDASVDLLEINPRGQS